MYFVTLGQRLASALASPLVMRRQLLPPNPSDTDRVICCDPHHGGVPAAALPPGLADAAPTDAAACVGVAEEPPPDGEAAGEHAESTISSAPTALTAVILERARVATRSVETIAPPRIVSAGLADVFA